MTITVQELQANIQATRQQEEAHRNVMHACSGAIQAYEQLLSKLIAEAREAAKAVPAPALVSHDYVDAPEPESQEEMDERLAKG